MDLKTAKLVLTDVPALDVSETGLSSFQERYIFASGGNEKAIVSGNFTADQLEAIATWMRDPFGVVNA